MSHTMLAAMSQGTLPLGGRPRRPLLRRWRLRPGASPEEALEEACAPYRPRALAAALAKAFVGAGVIEVGTDAAPRGCLAPGDLVIVARCDPDDPGEEGVRGRRWGEGISRDPALGGNVIAVVRSIPRA
ncbi:MAG: hypothetical protein ACE5EL_00505 [Anaerolineae bacterium]